MMDARDPVCGMSVDIVTAFSEAVGGETYYFCSESCRERFDADPAAYSARAAGEIRTGGRADAESSSFEFEFLPENHQS
jgi:P-type Cu+ transporter